MGMYDTICQVPITCPKCGDKRKKCVQIKSGPQALKVYKFGIDKIEMDWDYECYGSIIDKDGVDREKDNGKIRGIAECCVCKVRVNEKMEEIIEEYKSAGKIKMPEGGRFLLEAEIEGKSALKVILRDLDKAFGGSYHSESLFDVVLTIENGVAKEVELCKEDVKK